MSLDVSLSGKLVGKEPCRDCNGKGYHDVYEGGYDANITHNLNTMAEAAGIYEHVWKPEEIGITKAGQLIEPLTKGIEELKSNPDKYKQYNPPNGWGDYDGLITWLENYLKACIESPDSDIWVYR